MKALLAVTTTLALATAANAGPLTVHASVGGLPDIANHRIITFDGALPSDVHLDTTGDAGIVGGDIIGTQAAPYFSNGQGAALGETPANGLDATPYLTSGGGTFTLHFRSAQTYIGWINSSVDFQNVALFSATGAEVGSITGADIAGDPAAPGDRGPNGTRWVDVSSSEPFDAVQFSSPGKYAMEIDDVALRGVTSVQEPAPFAVLLSGLLGLAMVQRRACRNRVS